MSVQKLEVVKSARKDQGKCSRCGDALPAGSAYQYWFPGFRSKVKIVRCMKPGCTPRPSERETSKAATFLAAQENFEDNIDSLETVEEIQDAVQEVADAVTEVKDEYQEALDSWENGNEQLQEKVDHWEQQESEVDGWTWDGAEEPDLCAEHQVMDEPDAQVVEECTFCQDQREAWIEEVRNAAKEAVNSVEVG